MTERRNFVRAAHFIDRMDTNYKIVVIIDNTLPKPDQMSLAMSLMVALQDKRRVYIPAGFVTDCHSTPLWAQAILPEYNNRTNLAAIVHDYLYMHWEAYLVEYPELAGVNARAYADGVYKELMERFNRGRFRNKLYVAGVRAFGWWNWRMFRKRNIILPATPEMAGI